MERTCKKCGEKKPIEKFSFSNGNYRLSCKSCMCLWAKEHCNKERIKDYRAKNKEIIKQKEKEYRETGRARSNWNKWKKNNKEKLKQQVHDSYLRRKESLKEKRKAGNNKWESRSREYQLKYRLKNKQKILSSSRKYTLKAVETLNDSYSKALLKHKGYKSVDILKYPKLIECQRLITKIKRLANENSNRP